MRRLVVLALVGATTVLAGCIGDTDPAVNVRAHQADLKAHGRTNNGPAYWWWEYGTTRKGVANGQGTDTTHLGPASSTNDTNLTRTVTGLDNDQSYYFRACGQDAAAGSVPGCGRIYSFTTASGDTSVFSVFYGVRYFGSNSVRHALTVDDGPGGASHIRIQQALDPSETPPIGTAFIPGDNCIGSSSQGVSFVDSVDCTPPAHYLELNLGAQDDYVNQVGTSEISASLLDGDDYYSGYNAEDSVSSGNGDDTMYGYASDDFFFGGPGKDHLEGMSGADRLYGEENDDTLVGGSEDDLIYDASGNNTVDCGTGNDTYYTDTLAHFNQSVGCETFMQASTASVSRSRTAAMKKAGLDQ